MLVARRSLNAEFSVRSLSLGCRSTSSAVGNSCERQMNFCERIRGKSDFVYELQRKLVSLPRLNSESLVTESSASRARINEHARGSLRVFAPIHQYSARHFTRCVPSAADSFQKPRRTFLLYASLEVTTILHRAGIDNLIITATDNEL